MLALFMIADVKVFLNHMFVHLIQMIKLARCRLLCIHEWDFFLGSNYCTPAHKITSLVQQSISPIEVPSGMQNSTWYKTLQTTTQWRGMDVGLGDSQIINHMSADLTSTPGM